MKIRGYLPLNSGHSILHHVLVHPLPLLGQGLSLGGHVDDTTHADHVGGTLLDAEAGLEAFAMLSLVQLLSDVVDDVEARLGNACNKRMY